MDKAHVKRVSVPRRDAKRDVLVDPVEEAIRALERGGRLTPESVVAAARDPQSPLHDRFEWDDTAAANAWRLVQARQLIRSVHVNVTVDDRVISTVHYVRDPMVEAEDQGYVSVDQLRSEPDNARAMLRYEVSRALACLQRAEDLAAVLGVQAEVQASVRRLEKLRKRIEAQP